MLLWPLLLDIPYLAVHKDDLHVFVDEDLLGSEIHDLLMVAERILLSSGSSELHGFTLDDRCDGWVCDHGVDGRLHILRVMVSRPGSLRSTLPDTAY